MTGGKKKGKHYYTSNLVVPRAKLRLKSGLILKLIFKKSFGWGGVGMYLSASGLGQTVGSFERGDGPSGSIKLAKFLD